MAAILGPKRLREFYGRLKNAFFLQGKPMSIKFLVWGGGYLGFGVGGGKCRFYFYRRGIFLKYWEFPLTWCFQTWLFAIFMQKRSFALFCDLLRPFALFCGLAFCAHLRSFCVRPRLERPRLLEKVPRGNTIRGNRLRASERKSASERTFETL